MSFLAALGIHLAGKAVCSGITAAGYKLYDKGEKRIQNKYRASGVHDERFSLLITPGNARYLDYIKEINEYRVGYGMSELISMEKAKKNREHYLEIFGRDGKVDSAGYCLDMWGQRCN